MTSLAVDRQVSTATQRQALAALLFLYKEVLALDLPWLDDITRAKERVRMPVVLSKSEVGRLLAVLEGTHALMARLLYGTGMRLMECLRLWVKDVDFDRLGNHRPGGQGRTGRDRPAGLLSGGRARQDSDCFRYIPVLDPRLRGNDD